jgi:hypothetical protein
MPQWTLLSMVIDPISARVPLETHGAARLKAYIQDLLDLRGDVGDPADADRADDHRAGCPVGQAAGVSIRVRAMTVVPWLCAASGLFNGPPAGRRAGAVFTVIAGPPQGSLGHLMTGKLAV